MAKNKDKPEKPEKPHVFDVELYVPSYRKFEGVRDIRMSATHTTITYKRKGSKLRNEAIFLNERVVSIIGDAISGESTITYLDEKTPLHEDRHYKLSGTVDETDCTYLRVVNVTTGAISFVNPKFANVWRPDDEANKDVPKRGRPSNKDKQQRLEAEAAKGKKDKRKDREEITARSQRDRFDKKRRDKDKEREPKKKVRSDWF